MLDLSLPQLQTSAFAGRPAAAPPPAPDAARRAGHLWDSHGRRIRDLRLSITDRCNFRCLYCLEPDTTFLPSRELVGAADHVRLARIAASLGIEKIRLTGGEPTLHPALGEIIAGVAASGVRDVAITTNGATLERRTLERWRTLGLRRVTISIDAVEPATFARLTRSRYDVARVLDGIQATLDAGFEETKLNAVVIRGLNEDQIVPLTELARRYDVEMRFIEFMPLDDGREWRREDVVAADEIVAAIDRVHRLVPAGRDDPSATALRYRFADGAPGSIGVIAPVSRPFCGACSRLRITADGKVRPCLFSTREYDLRPLLVAGADDDAIRQFLADATWTKQAGHGIATSAFERADRTMSAIGG
ncbi:MAG: GTP 3',8-cyclase MoaA [Phycisphaerae bacterium]|nr:GTP 3',8-cyclase MoaA [Phycisphaerae bacterium]